MLTQHQWATLCADGTPVGDFVRLHLPTKRTKLFNICIRSFETLGGRPGTLLAVQLHGNAERMAARSIAGKNCEGESSNLTLYKMCAARATPIGEADGRE